MIDIDSRHTRWFNDYNYTYAVIDIDGDDHIYRFDNHKDVHVPEAWVWQVPEDARELDTIDTMYFPDFYEWYINYIYNPETSKGVACDIR